MARLAHELRVFGVRHGTGADAEVVEIRLVRRALVVLPIVGPHGKLARRDPCDLQHG